MPTFTDDFNRSDRPLDDDNGWFTGPTGYGFNIVSNTARPAWSGKHATVLQKGVGLLTDSDTEVTWIYGGSYSSVPGLLARIQPTAFSGYALAYDHGINNALYIYRYTNGAKAQLAYKYHGLEDAITFQLVVTGSTITGYLCGYSYTTKTVTDATYVSGYSGIEDELGYSTSGTRYDTFKMTYTPAPLASGLLVAQRGGVSPLAGALVPGYMMKRFRRRRSGILAPRRRLATC